MMPDRLSLEPILRCPTCAKSYHAGFLNRGVTLPECQKCRQRWWAMLLRPGAVRPQLAYEFEDDGIAQLLITTYGFPDMLPERRYWQLALRPKEAHEYREAAPLFLFERLLLIPKPAFVM